MRGMAALLFFSALICSAHGIEKEKLGRNVKNERHLSELATDEEYVKRQMALKEEKRRQQEIERERSDSVLDVKYHTEKYYEIDGRLLRIEFLGKTGTFNIFCKAPKNNGKTDTGSKKSAAGSVREIPLLADADSCLSTGFLLNLDGEIYHLNRTSRVEKELRRITGGAQLVYTIGHRIRFIVDFSLISSGKDGPEDIVRVRMYTISLDKQPHSVAVKGIFDTVTGEGSSVHFTTDAGTKIRGETMFSAAEMERERSVVLADDMASYQFVLDGSGVSPVKSVILANIDELYKMSWTPVIRKGRGFTNIRGYDDSGIMVDWPEFVNPGDRYSEHTFYIAASVNDEHPKGLYYIDAVSAAEFSLAGDMEKDDAEPGDEKQPAEPPRARAGKGSDKRTDVDFIIMPVKDYQLDPEYIQNLIDRIDALQSSKDVNQSELRKLNAELDAILEKLRQR